MEDENGERGSGKGEAAKGKRLWGGWVEESGVREARKDHREREEKRKERRKESGNKIGSECGERGKS